MNIACLHSLNVSVSVHGYVSDERAEYLMLSVDADDHSNIRHFDSMQAAVQRRAHKTLNSAENVRMEHGLAGSHDPNKPNANAMDNCVRLCMSRHRQTIRMWAQMAS